ncbi:hypothetical protein B7494_g1949 [Chlorociboria aeruginascens]|nr:hypothetical protein B7494_g1949 [Chlorociboria aeruginascens]
MESRGGDQFAADWPEELQHLLPLIPDEAASPPNQSAPVCTTATQQGPLPSSVTRRSVLWDEADSFADSDEENAAFLARVRADRKTTTQTFAAVAPRSEFPEPPRTIRQKLRRTKIQTKALLKNPKVDLQFAQLPRGVNNKIEEDKDPLKDKYRRWRNPPPKSQPPTPWNIYDEPEKRSYYVAAPNLRAKEGVEPAPPRLAPVIKPQAEFKSGPTYDEWCNPFGGEHAEFNLSPEERAQRIAEVDADVALRKESDAYLRRQGRSHLNDWKIGRPPPMSRRLLDEPIKRRASRAKRRQSDLFKIPETPIIPEVDPKDLRPSPGDRPHLWDRAFLSNKTSVAFSNKAEGNIPTSAEASSPELLSPSFDKTSGAHPNSIEGPRTLSSSQVSRTKNESAQGSGFFRNSQSYFKEPQKGRLWEFIDSDDESSGSCYSRDEDDTSKTLQTAYVQGGSEDEAGGISGTYTKELQDIDNLPDDDQCKQNEVRALQIPNETAPKPGHSPLQPDFDKGSPIRRAQTNHERPHYEKTVQPDAEEADYPRLLHRAPKLVILKPQKPLDHPSSPGQQRSSEPPVLPGPLVETIGEQVSSWLDANNNKDEFSEPPVSPVRLARKNKSYNEHPPTKVPNILQPPVRLAPGVPSASTEAHSSQPCPPLPRPFPYGGTLVEHSLETSFGNARANSTSAAAQLNRHGVRNRSIASGNLRGRSFIGGNFWNKRRVWEINEEDDQDQNPETSRREKLQDQRFETEEDHHLQNQTSEVGVPPVTMVQDRQVHTTQTTPVQNTSFEPVSDSRRRGKGLYTTPVRNAFLRMASGSSQSKRPEADVPQASPVQDAIHNYERADTRRGVGASYATPVQNAFLKPIGDGSQSQAGGSYITPVRKLFSKTASGGRQQRAEAAPGRTPSATFESEGHKQRRIGRPEVTQNLGLGVIFKTDDKRDDQIQRSDAIVALPPSAMVEIAASGASSPKNSGSDGTTASSAAHASAHSHSREGSLPPGALYAAVRAGAQTTADHPSHPPSSRSPRTRTRFEAGTGLRPFSYHINQDEQLSLADPRPKPTQSFPLPKLTKDAGKQLDSASRGLQSIVQSSTRLNRKRENTVSSLRSRPTQSANPPVLDLIPKSDDKAVPVRSRPLSRAGEAAPVFLPVHTKFQAISEEPPQSGLPPTDTKAQVSRAGTPTVDVETLSEAEMDRLSVNRAETNPVKLKAKEDAKQMWASVMESTKKTGKPLPNYLLNELIGKGSFGRVYKARNVTTGKDVAVKIIDIDESDTINPRNADSYSEFLKEVNALKLLSESKARNINHVIEALPVGQSMWMVTEYCGGGSVATLMKPTSPGGLQEKWIIPIVREVAEALKWVHQAGANVLITEQGGVQLCDFGVAGTIETKLDKRSTIIGTPHWMAPELFDATPSYGKEVDIWAFGAMVYEIATGLPPNVANGISYDRLGSHLKQSVPRLEGGSYSNELRNLVAYCLEELPSSRPTIEQVQKHPYIFNTALRYPETTLSYLVRAFKMWEDSGGNRRSLFSAAGAQGPSELSSTALSDDSWNFSTTTDFDEDAVGGPALQNVIDAYGTSVGLGDEFSEVTARPNPQKGSRRRPPPEALAPLRAPLEKIFDPNTLSNYEDNSRNHYGRLMQQPASDLPLRDDSAQTSIRDTLIDLGGHDAETGLSSFPDMDTIKAIRYDQDNGTGEYSSNIHDFSRPTHSDPAENSNRRTQDWKFPSMIPPASADSELSRFPNNYDLPRPSMTPGSGGRPTLIHHPTEPVGAFGGGLSSMQNNMPRLSVSDSLIDLDMSVPDPIPNYPRPSTADSDAGSVTSESASDATLSANPFEFERHASLYQPIQSNQREPSIYVYEGGAVPLRLQTGNPLTDLANVSDFSSDAEGPPLSTDGNGSSRYDPIGFSDSEAMPPPPQPYPISQPSSSDQIYTVDHIPSLPEFPIQSLVNESTRDEFAQDIRGSLRGLSGQLRAFSDVYDSPQIAPKGSMRQRRDGPDGGASGSQV